MSLPRPFRAYPCPRRVFLLGLVATCLITVGCGKKATQAATSLAQSATGQGDAQKFGKAGTMLLQACTEPTTAFHFSYKAQSQINPKYPMEQGAKPEVGPVGLEADISPETIKTVTERAGKKSESTALKAKELDWAMTKLALLGPLSDISMTMAFAAPVARLAGSDTVGSCAADKFVFDTRGASATEKLGMSTAQNMLGGRVKHEAIYGTAWVDKAGGMLVKVNMDTELSDANGNRWKEHYEGEVTPKR